MKKLLREPLLHFLLIGALFFIADKLLHPEKENEDAHVITVHEQEIAPAIETFKRNNDHAPSQQELKTLLDFYLLEEIFYREAVSMNMNENNPAVKRLVAQQYEEFIKEQVNAFSPGDDSLNTFLAKQ